MKEKEPRRFTFEKVNKRSKWKGIILGFITFILVFGIAAGAYLYTRTDFFGKEKLMAFFDRNHEKNNSAADEAKEATILFMSISSEKTEESGAREIYFLVLAHADTGGKTINFCPLQVKDSYVKSFEDGGESEIVDEVEKEYGVNIDRYVSSNENTFALAINYMGGLQYNVEENVTYRTADLTLILTPGQQTLKGENLLKYLKYFKEKDLSMQGELFCAMTNNYLTEKNTEKATQVFKGVLANLADNTDISYVDMADNLDSLKIFASDPEASFRTVSSVNEL